MKSIKYMCLAFVALFAASCSDDNTFEPGAPAVKGGEKVYFSDENENSIVVALTDTEIPVVLVREDGAKEAVVPVKFTTGAEGVFTAPASVKFEAGKTEATYVVTMTDKMEAFKSYSFQLTVDEAYTNPYAYDEESLFPRFDMTVLKEDYAPYAYGVYYSDFWGEEWEEVLEYSPMLDTYRIPGWWTGAQGFTFTWNKETNKLKMGATKFPTGMPYGDYGEVSGDTSDAKSNFVFIPKGGDNGEDIFWFDFKWTVSAGSFGIYPEIFTVTSYAK